jgi:hypothetical protein
MVIQTSKVIFRRSGKLTVDERRVIQVRIELRSQLILRIVDLHHVPVERAGLDGLLRQIGQRRVPGNDRVPSEVEDGVVCKNGSVIWR